MFYLNFQEEGILSSETFSLKHVTKISFQTREVLLDIIKISLNRRH